MSPADFRRLAIGLPQAVAGAHQGTSDFRLAGRIFASLGWPADGYAMVKLTPEQQELLVAAEPALFSPVPGGWGRRGATLLALAAADEVAAASALAMAWRNVAPKRLAG